MLKIENFLAKEFHLLKLINEILKWQNFQLRLRKIVFVLFHFFQDPK